MFMTGLNSENACNNVFPHAMLKHQTFKSFGFHSEIEMYLAFMLSLDVCECANMVDSILFQRILILLKSNIFVGNRLEQTVQLSGKLLCTHRKGPL